MKTSPTCFWNVLRSQVASKNAEQPHLLFPITLAFLQECLGGGSSISFYLSVKSINRSPTWNNDAEPAVFDTRSSLQAYCCCLPELRGWQALPASALRPTLIPMPALVPATPLHHHLQCPGASRTRSDPYSQTRRPRSSPPAPPLQGRSYMQEPMLSLVSVWQSPIYPLASPDVTNSVSLSS